MFYHEVVAPGKPVPFVPPPQDVMLHLSQACLAHDAPEGARVSLLARLDADEQPAVVCTLTAGRQDNAPLDLFLSHYAEFSVAGRGGANGQPPAVHLSGYFAPAHEEASDGGEEDDEVRSGTFILSCARASVLYMCVCVRLCVCACACALCGAVLGFGAGTGGKQSVVVFAAALSVTTTNHSSPPSPVSTHTPGASHKPHTRTTPERRGDAPRDGAAHAARRRARGRLGR